MKHKHHIIPKHQGGSDDPSNLIEVTVEEHAELHRIRYEETGNHYDWLAWKGLTGQIGKDEILKEIYRQNGYRCSQGNFGRIPWNKGKKGSQVPWNKGLTKSDPRVAKNAASLVGHKHSPETIEKLRKPKTEEHKKKLADSVRNYHRNN